MILLIDNNLFGDIDLLRGGIILPRRSSLPRSLGGDGDLDDDDLDHDLAGDDDLDDLGDGDLDLDLEDDFDFGDDDFDFDDLSINFFFKKN